MPTLPSTLLPSPLAISHPPPTHPLLLRLLLGGITTQRSYNNKLTAFLLIYLGLDQVQNLLLYFTESFVAGSDTAVQ